ncbi:hypothetical protein [Streptomyces sp. NPDC050585]|uniref:hypothetical protein n=1 Tax=Streptomyces sp. NPDC050585 TaxID=3365632 RepID=UPI0037B675FC
MGEQTKQPPAELQRYAKALRGLLNSAPGATQAGLISHAQKQAKAKWDRSAVSRYFSGQRVAPEIFLERLIAYIEHLGTPVTKGAKEELHALWRAADEAVNLRYPQRAALQKEVTLRDAEISRLQVEVKQLRAQVAQRDEELAGRDGRAQQLSEQLASKETEIALCRVALYTTLGRAEDAEDDRDNLRRLVGRQQKQLEHASSSTRELERELNAAQGKATRWEREVATLRHQVDQLLHDSPNPAPSDRASAPAGAPSATQAAATAPPHAPGPYSHPHPPSGSHPHWGHPNPYASPAGPPPPGHAPPYTAAPYPPGQPRPDAAGHRRPRTAPVIITALAIALVVCATTTAKLLADAGKNTAAAPGASTPSQTASSPAPEPQGEDSIRSAGPSLKDSATPTTKPTPANPAPTPNDEDPRRALDKYLTGVFEITLSDGNALDIDGQTLHAPQAQDNEFLLYRDPVEGPVIVNFNLSTERPNPGVKLGLINSKDLPQCAKRTRLVPEGTPISVNGGDVNDHACVFTSEKRWALVQAFVEQTSEDSVTEVTFRIGFVK